MIPIDIQVNRSKVKPTLHMLGKGGICVLQTAIFSIKFAFETATSYLYQ